MVLLTEGVLTYTEMENMSSEDFMRVSTAYAMFASKRNKEMKKSLK